MIVKPLGFFLFRPCVMFTNPLEHFSITIKEMISLDANEALVVYREDESTKEVTRYVQFGPTLVMPLANEWYEAVNLKPFISQQP